jgi:hypothetical protein
MGSDTTSIVDVNVDKGLSSPRDRRHSSPPIPKSLCGPSDRPTQELRDSFLTGACIETATDWRTRERCEQPVEKVPALVEKIARDPWINLLVGA